MKRIHLFNGVRSFVFVTALLFVLLAGGISVNAATADTKEETPEVLTTDFVDMTFVIGKNTYTSKTASKKMDIAPVIDNGRTLVPFRTIFEELGYSVQWDDQTRSVNAVYKGSIITLQIDSATAYVDNNPVTLDVAPKIEKSRTLVPLRFVAECSGAFVDWDGDAKSIHITRVGKFNTGTVLFYDNKGKIPKVYIYDGENIASVSLEGKEIKNSLAYKGGLLLTDFDKENDTNNLLTYRNGSFVTLITNFEIKEKVEYNNNLLLHGYARRQKLDCIFRFDGRNIYLVADNFAMGNYVMLNDKLVINKYDNFRKYSLCVFDTNSWTPHVLQNDFIIKDSMIEDNILFMSAVLSSGSMKPFASYDGSVFRIIHDNLEIDLARTIRFVDRNNVSNILTVAKKDGKKDYFVVLRDTGYYSSNYDVFDLFLPDSVFEDVDMKPRTVTVSGIVDYNNAIYISLKETYSVIEARNLVALSSIPDYTKKENTFSGDDADYILLDNVKTIYKDSTYIDMFQQGRQMLIHLQNKNDKDYVLYIHNNNEVSAARDVVKIDNILDIRNRLFIDVQDIDRITDKKRSALLFYNADEYNVNSRIRNLVIGMKTNVWEELFGSLVVNGVEDDIKRSKVYIYSDEFKELLGNFQVSYWERIGNRIFTSGKDTDSNTMSLQKIDTMTTHLLKDKFAAKKMVKAQEGSYYFVFGTEQTPKTPYTNKNILYIFDESTGKFVDMVVDIQLTDMLVID